MTNEQKLAKEMPITGYPIHPAAAAFPQMSDREWDEFLSDVDRRGVREKIILIDDTDGVRKVLDGRNRQTAALALGIVPPFRSYDPEVDGESPLDFVVSENLRRRHLSAAARADIAVALLPMYEAEAEARQNAGKATGEQTLAPNGAKVNQSDPEGVSQANNFDPADENQAAGKGKSAAQVAAKVGVSTRSVERAKKRAGKTKTKKPTKVKADPDKVAAAVARIEKICGKQMATGVREEAYLRQPKDLIKYASYDDDKMLALRDLIRHGWKLARAVLVKAKFIRETHTVRDVTERALLAGGTYKQDVLIDNEGIIARLTLEIVTGDPVEKLRKKIEGK